MIADEENAIGMTNSDKKTYTVDEIATILNISKKATYALIKRNVFHSIKVGRLIRVSKSSFDKWLNP